MAGTKPTPITLARLDTPKTLTPAELEVINKNWFTIQETINKIIAQLP
jgi:hypothetical protein